MDAAAYAPHCLSAVDAALMRGLARRRHVPRVDGLDIRITEPPATIIDPVVLHLVTRHGKARATLSRSQLHDLLGRLDPAAPGAAPHWEGLLLELAIEHWLERLGAIAPSLAFVIAQGDAPSLSEPFALGLDIDDTVFRLEFGASLANAVVTALKALPDASHPLPGVTFALHLRALATAVALQDWRSVRVGDVVLADALPDGEVLLVAGETFAWRARRVARQLTVTTPRRRAGAMGLGEWIMQDDSDVTGKPDGDLDDLPVRLAFELGRLELTLGELQAIGPGHVFELARAEEEAVDIIANGRRVGRGRIVSVAGAVGVQVVRLGAG